MIAFGEFMSGSTSISEGQEMVGKLVSTTVTKNEQVDVKFTLLTAVHVTVLLPSGKSELLAGLQDEVNVTPATSDTVCVYVARADGSFPVV
jgi:hypothetical protein